MRKYTHHLLSLVCSIIILAGCLGTVGCLAGNRIASPTTTITVKPEVTVDTIKGEDVGTGGVVGKIGGGGDSIALWIAILALAVGPVLYPLQRTIRVRWENGKNGGKNGSQNRRKTDSAQWRAKCHVCGK